MRRIQHTQVRLERGRDGRMWAHRADASAPVRPHRCFPWSAPGRFISLRDEGREEFALVVDPADLDRDSREVLEQELATAGLVLEIIQVLDIDDEVEIRTWSVLTRQGPRKFQTRLDDWPREVPGGRLLIRDVSGDLYCVEDREALDRRSSRLLWALAG